METRPSYGGFDEPLDTAEKLLTEQAECAVTKAKLSEALKALQNIRGMIAGRAIYSDVRVDHSALEALIGLIEEEIEGVLEGEQPKVCTWHNVDDPDYGGHWETTCGLDWWFEDGGPIENEMNFCPKCGSTLVEQEEPEHDSPDSNLS